MSFVLFDLSVHDKIFVGVMVLAAVTDSPSLQNLRHCMLPCRITLLRLKPYMFEPDASDELRVKEPLASFLGKFKKVPV